MSDLDNDHDLVYITEIVVIIKGVKHVCLFIHLTLRNRAWIRV